VSTPQIANAVPAGAERAIRTRPTRGSSIPTGARPRDLPTSGANRASGRDGRGEVGEAARAASEAAVRRASCSRRRAMAMMRGGEYPGVRRCRAKTSTFVNIRAAQVGRVGNGSVCLGALRHLAASLCKLLTLLFQNGLVGGRKPLTTAAIRARKRSA
jgi:hypothetical protein